MREALDPMMSVLIVREVLDTERDTDRQGKRSWEDGSRVWGDAITSQGRPGTPRTWKEQKVPSPGTFCGSVTCPLLDFRLMVSRAVQ
jgi:hypothetical protein